MVLDTGHFIIHLFRRRTEESSDNDDKIIYLSLKQFEMVEEIIEELKPSSRKDDETVPFRTIIKMLQTRLELF